jgi:uncharacterized protein (DUF983 family)
MHAPPKTPVVLWRGARRRCPRCGVGRLFAAYLTQVDVCPNCGARFDGLDAADGPAWLTIGLVAPVVIPLLLFMETYAALSAAAEGLILVAATTIAALALLPVARGIFLAGLWLTRADRS